MLVALQGAVSQGILWGIMVLGVFITFRLLDIPDMTVDGSFALGGSVVAVLVVNLGVDPVVAVLVGMLAGAVAAAGGGFTLHSDRGWHFRTPDWVRACGEAGVERSMSRKGHSPDNAACEGFFGRLKVEFFHGRDWRGVSAERFAAELAEWIRWYREGRLKAFDEGGRKVYDTIAGRRRRLGLAA